MHIPENARSQLSSYKLYYPSFSLSPALLIPILCKHLTNLHVEPIGMHRVGDAIEFAANVTHQDDINLRNFFLSRDAVDIYLLKADEEILIVNSCGYDFRESVSEIGKALTDNAKIVHYYRQKRKYHDRYIESGTITFWVKDIRHPLLHKIDNRRRCYFNDTQHDSLLLNHPESTHDLNANATLFEPMVVDVSLDAHSAVPAVTPPMEAGVVTEAAMVPADEPPVKRAAFSQDPLNPDLAPAENAGELRGPESAESVTAPPTVLSPAIPPVILPVPLSALPKRLSHSRPATRQVRIPASLLPRYPWQSLDHFKYTYTIDDTTSRYHGLTLNYDEFYALAKPRPHIPMHALDNFSHSKKEDTAAQHLWSKENNCPYPYNCSIYDITEARCRFIRFSRDYNTSKN